MFPVSIISIGPSRLGQPGPRLQQMMDSGDLNASSAGGSTSLNASIRERLRSKVRGRQVIVACIVNMYRVRLFGGQW